MLEAKVSKINATALALVWLLPTLAWAKNWFSLDESPEFASLRWLYYSLFLLAVVGAYGTMRTLIKGRFQGVAVRVADDGLYVEGLTLAPISWRDVALIEKEKSSAKRRNILPLGTGVLAVLRKLFTKGPDRGEKIDGIYLLGPSIRFTVKDKGMLAPYAPFRPRFGMRPSWLFLRKNCSIDCDLLDVPKEKIVETMKAAMAKASTPQA